MRNLTIRRRSFSQNMSEREGFRTPGGPALQGHGGLRRGERTRNPEAVGGGIVQGIPS